MLQTFTKQGTPEVSRSVPRAWTRRRSVLSAAAALTVLPLVGGCSGPPPALRDVGNGGTTIQRPVGSAFTYGLVVLYNDSDAPIEIRDVQPEIKGTGLAFLGARVLAPALDSPGRQTASYDILEGFPPEQFPAAPEATGALVNPASQSEPEGKLPYELLVGYRVTAPGRTTVPSIKITYRQGDDQQSMTANLTLAVCTDREMSDCPPEYGAAE